MHIGIDPGLSGAVAVLAADGALVALYDTPVLTLRRPVAAVGLSMTCQGWRGF